MIGRMVTAGDFYRRRRRHRRRHSMNGGTRSQMVARVATTAFFGTERQRKTET